MTRGSERKLHKLYSNSSGKDSIFTGMSTGGSTSLVHVIKVEGTIFNVLLFAISSAGWGSRGTKRKGEYIKMYSASVRKYDMRLITRIGLWRLRLALKQHTYYLEP